MNVYEVWIVSYSCDIMSEERGVELFLHEEDAEDYILQKGLLDKGYSDVYVKERKVHEVKYNGLV